MPFTRVEVTQFRNLTSSSFIPSPSLNLISGDNGSGKSSLLEAIHYLATGGSFRTHKLSTVINHQADCFTLYSVIADNVTHKIGLQRCRDLNHTTRIDGRDIKRRSDLVQLLPLQVISPESVSLLTEGSEHRRNFIDWSLFHVEHAFHYHLNHYHRALKQRNALLKRGMVSEKELYHWDVQLDEHGKLISGRRAEFINKLIPVVTELLSTLLPDVDIDFSYRQGWSREYDLAAALHHSYQSDLKMKYTSVGPHRGDLIVKCQDSKVSESLSRGQLKLTVVALKLAQALLLERDSSRKPVILIDDLAAELDVEHRALLLDTVQQLGSQVFITTPELSLIDHCRWDEKKVFHVEHGEVKEVV